MSEEVATVETEKKPKKVVKKIIVVGGDGYRQGALAYLKEHAGEVSIMDDNEFSLYIESLKKE